MEPDQPQSPTQQNQTMPSVYPVRLEIEYPEKSSRWWALATLVFFIGKTIAIIPHAIILYVLSFVMMFIVVIAQLVVLFTGKYPRPLFNFVVGFTRWQVRVNAFAIGLTDKYPPFSLE